MLELMAAELWQSQRTWSRGYPHAISMQGVQNTHAAINSYNLLHDPLGVIQEFSAINGTLHVAKIIPLLSCPNLAHPVCPAWILCNLAELMSC